MLHVLGWRAVKPESGADAGRRGPLPYVVVLAKDAKPSSMERHWHDEPSAAGRVHPEQCDAEQRDAESATSMDLNSYTLKRLMNLSTLNYSGVITPRLFVA